MKSLKRVVCLLVIMLMIGMNFGADFSLAVYTVKYDPDHEKKMMTGWSNKITSHINNINTNISKNISSISTENSINYPSFEEQARKKAKEAQNRLNKLIEDNAEKTISATEIETTLYENGTYYFKVKFDNDVDDYLVVKDTPIFKIKIGDKTRTLSCKSIEKNALVYTTQILDTKLCETQMTLDSITGGKISVLTPNIVVTMDYTSKLTNKDLGKVDKFMFVNPGSKGDINKDGRLDKLDVEKIQKSTNKTIADLNGDGKIDSEDKTALSKAISKNDTIYINFIYVNKNNQSNGDVCKTNGATGFDGIINYKDFEYVENAIAKNSNYGNKYADVNGDGEVNVKDAKAISQAIKNNNTLWLKYIKVAKSSKGDVNGDAIINVDDVLAISNKPQNGDINGDGKVDVRDQATLASIIQNEDVAKLNYIAVPTGAKGDVDGNGLINYEDAKHIANYLASGKLDSLCDPNIADVNNDGKVNVSDATYIATGLSKDNFGNINSKHWTTLISYGFALEPKEDGKGDGKGDVNGDGVVNIIDAQLIAEYLATKNNTKNINLDAIDYNGDGKSNVKDSASIAKDLADSKTVEDAEMADDNIEELTEINLVGDIDMDGRVGRVTDSILLAKYIANKNKYSLGEEQLKNADVTNDEKVDTADLLKIIEYVIGKIFEF